MIFPWDLDEAANSGVLVFAVEESETTPSCKLADFTHAQELIIGNRPGSPNMLCEHLAVADC